LGSLSLQSKTPATRIMKLLGATVACIFAGAIPFWYYFYSVSEIRNTLSIETVFIAKSVEKSIQTQPDLWEFDIVRLQEIISQDERGTDLKSVPPCERIIRNAAGIVVVKTDATARYPVVSASVTLFDSGRPVGSIETRHSIRTPVVFTVLLGIFSSLLGALIYFILRIYPIKKLDSTLAELQRAEEEQRLCRETAERLAEETAVIAEIGRLIGSTLNIDEVYERFAAEARKLIPFDRIAVNLNNHDQNTITVAYAFGLNIPGRKPGDSFPLQGSVNEALDRTRTGILLNPTNIDELTRQYPHLISTFQEQINSFISVPLISRDEVIGVLHFRSKKTDAYTEHHLRMAERIGAQIAGAIANAQLFTDLRKAEGSLRESEERSRALVEQAAVGVAEIEIHTSRFITVNRRLCEMVGRTEEEMLTTTFHAITHPADAPLDEEKRALLLAGKIRQYSREKRYLRKDGGIVWVNITISPLWKRGEKSGRNMIVVEDITERKRMEAEMREMSLRDLLTELYNRRGFITLAEQQIKAANRAKRPLQLTFIDLDRLKWINDTLGHEKGDRVLIDTAHLLRQTFRESDIIARLGGDEFAILSIDSGDKNHENVSQRLQQHIDAYNSKESRLYKLSMSWGTVVYHPDSPVSLDQLLSAADELMYTQKRAKSHRGD
jgi:diguanylate cyclase (GGDEF)-like protein/PAS domain S-box-containing protein